MGIVVLTKWVPHCWSVMVWDKLSISLTKVGMKFALAGALALPQYIPAMEILGSETVGEKNENKKKMMTKKKKKTDLLCEIEVCMGLIILVIFFRFAEVRRESKKGKNLYI